MKKISLCPKMSDEEFLARLSPLFERLRSTGVPASCAEIGEALGVGRVIVSRFERHVKDKLLLQFLKVGLEP